MLPTKMAGYYQSSFSQFSEFLYEPTSTRTLLIHCRGSVAWVESSDRGFAVGWSRGLDGCGVRMSHDPGLL